MTATSANPDPEPPRPVEPDPSDCCGEGCPRCVFDVYDAAMQAYRIALAQWRGRQADISGGGGLPS